MQTPINVDGEERIFHGTPDQVVLLNVEEYIEVDGAYPVRQRLHVRIDDFKSISELGHDLVEPRKDNVYQINAYSYLVQKYLSEWLNYLDHPRDEWPKEYKDHLFLADGVELPNVDEVVIDELSIMYLDMKKTRTFTSKGFGYAQGKQLGDYTDGKWRRRYPVEHEQIELSPIPHFSNSFIESKIKSGIRRQLESETLLAPPLEPERAAIMCRNCPVLDKCIEVGLEEGYTMVDQLPYASRG